MNLNYNPLIFIITAILLISCSATKHGTPFIADNGIQWGIQDSITGKVYLKPEYHYLNPTDYKNRFIAVDTSGQFMLVNHKGKPVTASTPRLIRLLKSHYAIIEHKTGKKGLLELKRCRFIIPPIYSSIEFFDEHNIGVSIDGKYGVVNLKHKELLPIKYNSIELVGQQYIVEIEGKYGVVNQEGETVIPIMFNQINHHKTFNGYELFLDGLVAAATPDGKIGPWLKGNLSGFNPHGYIYSKSNTTDDYTYNCIYNRAFKRLMPLEKGNMAYIPELKGYKWSHAGGDTIYFRSVIDKGIHFNTEYLIDLKQCYNNSCISKTKDGLFKLDGYGHIEKWPYTNIYPMNNNAHVIVKKDDFWGCVTWGKEVIVPFNYTLIWYNNRHQLYRARTDSTVHFYELSGKLRTQFLIDRNKGERIELLRDAYFKIRKGDKWALFSPAGAALTDFVFNELKDSYGICLGRIDNQWQFVNLEGEILPDRFKVIHPFHEIRAGKYIHTYRVRQGNLFGLYDSKGEMIIPVDYKSIFLPSEGLIAVLKEDKWGFINKKNDVVIPFLYDKGRTFHNGRARVEVNREKLWINKLGDEITVE